MADFFKNVKSISHVDGEGTILWCQEAMPPWMPLSFALDLCGAPFYFARAVFFIRWLFEPQPTDGSTPQRTLIVGWREAKPCAQAIFAARTGDTRGLRPDQKRPELEPLQVDKGIRTLILLVDGRRQEMRARTWAEDIVPGLDVHVVSTPSALVSLLQAEGTPLGSACSPPPGLECKLSPQDMPQPDLRGPFGLECKLSPQDMPQPDLRGPFGLECKLSPQDMPQPDLRGPFGFECKLSPQDTPQPDLRGPFGFECKLSPQEAARRFGDLLPVTPSGMYMSTVPWQLQDAAPHSMSIAAR